MHIRQIILLIMPVLAAACLALPEPQPTGPPIPTSVSDSGAFQQALQDIGLDVSGVTSPTTPSFEAQFEMLRVGQELVHLYQFETAQKRNTASSLIAPDASSIAGRQSQWNAEPTIWSSGRLIVIYDGLDGGLIQVITGILGDPITLQDPTSDEPYPPALLITMQTLAAQLGLDPATIQVIAFDAAEWNDACLELPQEGEDCQERSITGWLIHLRAADGDHRFHTDELGMEIRRERSGN